MAGVATQTGAGVEDVRRPEPAHITLLTRRRLETVACVATQTGAGIVTRRTTSPDTKEPAGVDAAQQMTTTPSQIAVAIVTEEEKEQEASTMAAASRRRSARFKETAWPRMSAVREAARRRSRMRTRNRAISSMTQYLLLHPTVASAGAFDGR